MPVRSSLYIMRILLPLAWSMLATSLLAADSALLDPVALVPAAPAAAALDHFERKVRPLLVEHCHSCHAGKKSKGGLLLDSRPAILKGGDSGPALVAGKPEESLLIQAVKQTHAEVKMPPRNKLSDAQVSDLVRWVASGAPYPGTGEGGIAVAAAPGIDLVKGARHWAFAPLASTTAPKVNDQAWPRDPIDHFILARLEEASLTPAPPADKRTLLRRVTFDLIGLPPTHDEIAAFLADESPDAFAKVVDHLLASPRYGERWGRHWLDLARYADSNGSDENKVYANAWRYRDYVISAFNSDKPYDRFLHEQIAGDLLPGQATETSDPAASYQRWTATGMLVLGPKMLAEQDKEKLVMDLVDEQLDVIGQSVLGLTLGCARCHDHKFDPISAEDYYALAGIFKSTKTMANLAFVSQVMQRELATPQQIAASKAHNKSVEELNKRIAAAEKDLKDKSKEAQGKEAREAALQSMREELKELKAKPLPTIDEAMAVTEGKPANVPVHIRGSHLNLAATAVERREPSVLSHLVKMEPIPKGQSGRLQLAHWITDTANPLPARVMVNRIWQHHFGQGLVKSSSNFGLRGDTPSHPQLLDHLATRFIQEKWSIKAMHRAILLSATYRMSTQHNERAAELDPDNQLLWRFNRTRLEAEPIRDALFAVAGNLDLKMGGTLMATKHDEYVPDNFRNGGEVFKSNRRAIYLPVVRNALYPLFSTFDYGDAGVPIAQRTSTTVSHQALFMLNSELVMDQATILATKLKTEAIDEQARLSRLYERLFTRLPTKIEQGKAMQFLDRAAQMIQDEKKTPVETRDVAWQRLCHALMASSEFVYVE